MHWSAQYLKDLRDMGDVVIIRTMEVDGCCSRLFIGERLKRAESN